MIHSGSSPRMRGTPWRLASARLRLGIIPAHAGNTMAIGVGTAAPGDHPRACGEHALKEMSLIPSMGSSPRMRGTPKGRVESFRELGIIPAHAGNTH